MNPDFPLLLGEHPNLNYICYFRFSNCYQLPESWDCDVTTLAYSINRCRGLGGCLPLYLYIYNMFVDRQAHPFALCSCFVFRVKFGFNYRSCMDSCTLNCFLFCFFSSQRLLNMERTWTCICYLLSSVNCIVDHEKLIAIKRNTL